MGKREMQTSVQHSYWLKHLIDMARGRVPAIDGMGVTKNDFFVLAAGEKATAIIKKSEALNYDAIKKEYELIHGAVSEYDDEEFAEEVDNGTREDAKFEQFQKQEG